MFKRIVLIGIVVVSPLASAYGFNVGLSHVVPGQPPIQVGSFGTAQTGGSAWQWAQAGGTGFVGQYAWAAGGQMSTPNVQLQGVTGGMSQTGVTSTGNADIAGTQAGSVHLNQATPTSTQSTYAGGFQGASISGSGVGATSQIVTIGIVQVQF